MRLRNSPRHAAFTWVEMLAAIVCIVVLLVGMILPAMTKGRGKNSRINCVNNLKNIGLAYRIVATDNGNCLPWEYTATNRPAALPTNYATFPGIPLPPSQGVAANFALLSNELSSLKLVICSEDRKRAPVKTNSFAYLMAPAQMTTRDRMVSYFIGTSAREELPQSILSGDRNLAGGPFGPDTNTPPSQVALRVPLTTGRASFNATVYTPDIHRQAGNLLLGDGSVQQVSSGRLREVLWDAKTGSQSDFTFLFPAR
jgi:type II secretory pathway pseudopilin PulG